MASKSNKNKQKKNSKKQSKGQKNHQNNKQKTKHKFNPSLPEWELQQKKYIEMQLSQWDYFQKRPHVYPCDNFEAFVQNIIQTLDKKGGDFCWSMDWEHVFFSQLIYNGFLTIAAQIQEDLYVMLPKLHAERCVIDMDKSSKTCNLPLVCSKSAKKRSKNYSITIDQCFEKVFQGCIDQHGLNWLYPPMQSVLYSLYKNRGNANVNGVTCHSIEIWNENGELVAGELGTSVGCIYTSLTGFYSESGTGSVQLLALGHLLIKCGVKLWDLGMFIEYKSSLGAGLLKRNAFVEKYKSLRNAKGMKLEAKEKMNCRDVVNDVRSLQSAENQSNDIEQKENDTNADNSAEKVLSRKAQKRLAKKEKRRLAILKAKQEKEKQTAMNTNEDKEDMKNVSNGAIGNE